MRFTAGRAGLHGRPAAQNRRCAWTVRIRRADPESDGGRLCSPYANSLRFDGLGSIIATQGTQVPRIMVDAHMDELGGVVRRITPRGLLTMQMLGGWLDQALVDQRWIIVGSKGPVACRNGNPRHSCCAAGGTLACLPTGQFVPGCGRELGGGSPRPWALDPATRWSRFAVHGLEWDQ